MATLEQYEVEEAAREIVLDLLSDSTEWLTVVDILNENYDDLDDEDYNSVYAVVERERADLLASYQSGSLSPLP